MRTILAAGLCAFVMAAWPVAVLAVDYTFKVPLNLTNIPATDAVGDAIRANLWCIVSHAGIPLAKATRKVPPFVGTYRGTLSVLVSAPSVADGYHCSVGFVDAVSGNSISLQGWNVSGHVVSGTIP